LPLYEYKCAKCGHVFEKIENLSASFTKKCPKCGGKAERQLTAPAIQFKGSGWYVTDYAGKNSSASGEKGEKSGEKPGDGAAKTPEKSSESKSSSDGKSESTDHKKKK
jgi:putative FmdB family regulatory protein